MLLEEEGGMGERGGRGEGTAPPLLKKASVPGAFSASLGRMIFFDGAFAGAVATATPMTYCSFANGVTVLLLTAARVEAATDLLVLHVLPGNPFDVAFKFLCRLTHWILTWSSEGSRNTIASEGGESSLFTSLVEELLDVGPIVPFNHLELEGFEELLDDGQDVLPWQDVGLANQVRLKMKLILNLYIDVVLVIDQNLLAESLLEVSKGLIPMAKLLLLSRLRLRPEVSRCTRDNIMCPDVLADTETSSAFSVLS